MLSRRSFLNGTIGAGAALATQGPYRAAAQVSRRLVVDAQIHVWKAESEDWKWVPGLRPQLPWPFTIEKAISMMDEAGVDRAVIALWLGHESVETTQQYVEATLAMKEKALAKTEPPNNRPSRYRPDDRLLRFLNGL